MIGEQTEHNGAQIGGGVEVAVFVELGFGEARPVVNDTALAAVRF